MALILICLLATVAIFGLIASIPLTTEAYHDAREEIAEGGWKAILAISVRAVAWLVVLILILMTATLGGMFI